jgi:hypothetical protein
MQLDLVLRVLVTALGLLRWKQGAAVLTEAAPNNSVWPLVAAEPLLFLSLPAGCGSEVERMWGVAGVWRLQSVERFGSFSPTAFSVSSMVLSDQTTLGQSLPHY